MRSPLFKPTDAQAAALRARLERLQQPATMLELLRSALLPAGFEPSAVVTCRQLTTHQDRVVLRVLTRADSGAEREYAVKIYCDDIVERIWSFTQTLADGVSAAVDQLGLPTAYVSQESALVSPWIDGTPLSEVHDVRASALLRRAASVVAGLHRRTVAPEPPTTSATLIDETLARRERLRTRWPAALPLVDPVLDELCAAAGALDAAAPAPVHGDLGGAQFLWTGSQLVLLDWDRFGFTDPAYDAGHFLAQLDRIAILNPARRAHAEDWVASFLDRYVAAMPGVSRRNVAFYRAMTLLAKTHTICRVHPSTWPQLVPQFTLAAHAALQGAATAGPARSQTEPTR